MKSRRGGWLQDRGRPKGRSLDSNHRNGLGPGGSGSKLEHPRFPVNVADLVRLETGPLTWIGTCGYWPLHTSRISDTGHFCWHLWTLPTTAYVCFL